MASNVNEINFGLFRIPIRNQRISHEVPKTDSSKAAEQDSKSSPTNSLPVSGPPNTPDAHKRDERKESEPDPMIYTLEALRAAVGIMYLLAIRSAVRSGEPAHAGQMYALPVELIVSALTSWLGLTGGGGGGSGCPWLEWGL